MQLAEKPGLTARDTRPARVFRQAASLAVRADEYLNRSGDWNPEDRWKFAADAEIATHVGPDFWSLEIALALDQEHLPAPEPGEVWGYNLVRNFRGERYLQWVRTYGSGLRPSDFGFLVFQ